MRKETLITLVIFLNTFSCMQKNEAIREELKYNDIIIRLYEPVHGFKVPYESISNISAFDKNNSPAWKAEIPKAHYDIYMSISIDTIKNVLVANSGIGYRYIIDLKDGKIIDYFVGK